MKSAGSAIADVAKSASKVAGAATNTTTEMILATGKIGKAGSELISGSVDAVNRFTNTSAKLADGSVDAANMVTKTGAKLADGSVDAVNSATKTGAKLADGSVDAVNSATKTGAEALSRSTRIALDVSEKGAQFAGEGIGLAGHGINLARGGVDLASDVLRGTNYAIKGLGGAAVSVKKWAGERYQERKESNAKASAIKQLGQMNAEEIRGGSDLEITRMDIIKRMKAQQDRVTFFINRTMARLDKLACDPVSLRTGFTKKCKHQDELSSTQNELRALLLKCEMDYEDWNTRVLGGESSIDAIKQTYKDQTLGAFNMMEKSKSLYNNFQSTLFGSSNASGGTRKRKKRSTRKTNQRKSLRSRKSIKSLKHRKSRKH